MRPSKASVGATREPAGSAPGPLGLSGRGVVKTGSGAEPLGSLKDPQRPKRKLQTHAELKELQRVTAAAIMRPLAAGDRILPDWLDGRKTADAVAEIIKPNDRLTGVERLEIYNRQYWFRLIDIMYEDHPGLRAVVGHRRFDGLVRAYLTEYPSRSFALQELSRDLPRFLKDNPKWSRPRQAMAVEIARFERAQTVGFDAAALPAVTPDDLLGRNPAELTFRLQPHITLLAMRYPLDEFSTVVRREVLRAEASNAKEGERQDAAEPSGEAAAPPPPKRQDVWIAVHRYRNALYYKRLEREAFLILAGLRDGKTLEQAVADGLPTVVDAGFGERLQGWFASWTEMGWFAKT
jgi:hypothetical protein